MCVSLPPSPLSEEILGSCAIAEWKTKAADVRDIRRSTMHAVLDSEDIASLGELAFVPLQPRWRAERRPAVHHHQPSRFFSDLMAFCESHDSDGAGAGPSGALDRALASFRRTKDGPNSASAPDTAAAAENHHQHHHQHHQHQHRADRYETQPSGDSSLQRVVTVALETVDEGDEHENDQAADREAERETAVEFAEPRSVEGRRPLPRGEGRRRGPKGWWTGGGCCTSFCPWWPYIYRLCRSA